MTTPSELAGRPEGHCTNDEAWAEFTRQYAGKPRSYADMTDFELANAVFMASRDDLSLIHYQTAAKERIRWLSIRLADALRRVEKMEAALGEAEQTLALSEFPSREDPEHGPEVRALGERIGFGAVIASASASWRLSLAAKGHPVGGEYVYGPCQATVTATLKAIRQALTGEAQ